MLKGTQIQNDINETAFKTFKVILNRQIPQSGKRSRRPSSKLTGRFCSVFYTKNYENTCNKLTLHEQEQV